MKKLYTTEEYKKIQERKIRRTKKKKSKKYKGPKTHVTQNNNPSHYQNKPEDTFKNKVIAPKDFSLLSNTEQCLRFFSELRIDDNISRVKGLKFVEMSLLNIEEIDYSTISVLTAISNDLALNDILLRGNFPIDENCKQFLVDSGFLDKMVDDNGKPFPKTDQSEVLIFEQGTGRFTKEDNLRISDVVKNIMRHLTGELGYCQSIRTILLEIFGNSIEWSGTENNQWQLGVKYENDRVIITVTDVGKGILKTLFRKHRQLFSDIITLQSNHNILKGAFEKKYGSKSKKVNRNKGLPSVKDKFDNGHIKELKVITNNVILHFDNEDLSNTLKSGSPWFKGTFYRWVVTKDCINNKTILS